MTATLRTAGEPSPLALDTHADAELRPPIPFDPAEVATVDPLPAAPLLHGEPIAFDMAPPPGWLSAATGLIRPICVGALMAIPTVGAATVGLVALFDGAAADRMTRASTAFLSGIPADVLLLIGALAGGYTVAKTAEKLAGRAEGQR